MNTITIPKNLIKNNDLVVITRKEYEEFYQWKEVAKLFKTFTPTVSEKRGLKKAREDYKKKKYFTLHEFKQQLAAKN
ncbi:MAG: hypothetical protein HZB10_00320 [Candidatus Yonathbacteria bacterium]|nr:hypothetical protein [Candidatus Yonathbacteria bacterium]